MYQNTYSQVRLVLPLQIWPIHTLPGSISFSKISGLLYNKLDVSGWYSIQLPFSTLVCLGGTENRSSFVFEYTLCLKKRPTFDLRDCVHLDIHDPITIIYGRSVTKNSVCCMCGEASGSRWLMTQMTNGQHACKYASLCSCLSICFFPYLMNFMLYTTLHEVLRLHNNAVLALHEAWCTT